MSSRKPTAAAHFPFAFCISYFTSSLPYCTAGHTRSRTTQICFGLVVMNKVSQMHGLAAVVTDLP